MYTFLRSVFALLLVLMLVACGAEPAPAARETPTAASGTAYPVPANVTPANASAAPGVGSPYPPAAPAMPTLVGTTSSTPGAERVTPLGGSGTVTDEVPLTLLDQIIADAGQRAKVDQSRITVQSASAVEWSDSSLGCSQPGKSYIQMITPGYKVVLDVAGKPYDYRASRDGVFVLCPAS